MGVVSIGMDSAFEVGLKLPDVKESPYYGGRALKLNGQMVACTPVNKSAEVNSVVVSRSLKSVGPNSTLVADDFEKVIRRLKAELAGEIQVAGPVLAQSLTEAGLIDEYRLYLRPVVFGGGQPFFAGPRPPLHLVASDLIADDLIRLPYVPA
jgi:riboflavin biosynthesis pyrimidine reductase